MKVLSFAVAAMSAFVANGNTHQQSDIYYHEKPVLGASMWHFSADGLTIYSPEGEVLKSHRKASLCKPYMSWRGDEVDDCYYYTQASDGHRYVWAGSFAVQPHVEAFDIDTGDYAGYINTCSTPLDMEYHTTRNEMWLRCAQELSEEGHTGEIDVFSSASLSADYNLISLNDTRRPYGRFAIHSSMGPYGYASGYDLSYISELDLSEKHVSERYEIPKAYGAYDMTYSPVNEHLFMRVRVCCTCGFEGADVAECGRGGGKPVHVQTGPSASDEMQDGMCSSGCEGTVADTIGVAEFDIVGKQFVAEHNILEGTGFGADPVGSPDGEYILLLPNDGGQYVRVIKPGKNGMASSVLTDIPVDFQGGTPGRSVVSDFAFVNNNGRNILVLGASTDNDVVIVDLNDPNFRMVKLPLTSEEESTGGNSRKLEWAVGTNFVWVNGGESLELYILDIPDTIDSAYVKKVIDEAVAGDLIFVNNYERLRTNMMASSLSMAAADDAKAAFALNAPEEEGTDTLGLSGTILGAIGLLVGLVLGVTMFSQKSDQKSSDTNRETMSLGSKDVA